MRDLLAKLTQAMDAEQPLVYCSVVETRGSTPQKAGAAMLVFPDGGQFGTLGGGCIEAEVKQRALRTLAGDEGKPQLLTFNLDDNYGWDDGLICGGRMTILADPLLAARQRGPSDYYRTFQRLIETGRGCTETVVLNGQLGAEPGQRFLLDAEGLLAAQRVEGDPPEALVRLLPPLRSRPRPSTAQGLAFLPILPRVTLLIVGGGHVGQAVAKLAAEVDFDIWVMDDRAAYASSERFPSASRCFVGDIAGQLNDLAPALDGSFFCLIVTRGHQHDEEALFHLATTSAGYVGMIGSKRKIKLILEDLRARGVTAEALTRVHAPLGFAIGSQTVPEIAISIVAELIACRNLGATLPAARERVPL